MTPALIGAAGAVLVGVITWLLTLRDVWVTRKAAQQHLDDNLRAVKSLLDAGVKDKANETERVAYDEDQAERLTLWAWTDSASRTALRSHLNPSTATAVDELQGALTRTKTAVKKPTAEIPPAATVGALKLRSSSIAGVLDKLHRDNTRRYAKRAGVAAVVVILLLGAGAGIGDYVDQETLTGNEVAEIVTEPLATAAVTGQTRAWISNCKDQGASRYACTVVIGACDQPADGACLTVVKAQVHAEPDTESAQIDEIEEEQFRRSVSPPRLPATEAEKKEARRLRAKFTAQLNAVKGAIWKRK